MLTTTKTLITLFAAVLLLGGCDKNRSNTETIPTKTTVNVTTTESNQQPQTQQISIIGEWNTIEGRVGTPDGFQFNFAENRFSQSHFYHGYSKGGSPAYILINSGGTYSITNDSLELVYDYPTCMAGARINFSISNLKPERSGFTLTAVNGAFIDLFPGNVVERVKTLKPIETSDCKYANLNISKGRLPANTKPKSFFDSINK